jgi:peroxiredoxin Q/BCP
MAIKTGDIAPVFDVTSSDGKHLRLEDFRGKKVVVLYFYPKDDTRVCTAEACGFRDMYEDLVGRDTEVIGVSTDTDQSHRAFGEKYRVPFPLVADPKRRLAKLYGANGGFVGLLGLSNRITFVIDKQGKVAGVFEGLLSANRHLEGVKEAVRRLTV